MFWTESAFQYRFAKIMAEQGKLPAVDYRAQYPEGVNVFEEFTVLMEITSGYIYRLFFSRTGIPFHKFIIYFMSFCSALPIFPVFLISRLLTKSNLSGIISSAFYAVTRVNFLRVIGGGFEYEIFAFPFITLGIYLFLLSIHKRKLIYSIIASICFDLALISWHFTHFFLTIFIFCLCVYYYITSNESVSDLLVKNFGVITISFLITGIISPVLRNKYFLCSVMMIVCYGFLLTFFLQKYFGFIRKRKLFFFFFICIFIYILSLFSFPQHQSEFGHVFSLFKYKILYLNQKPDNPEILPFDAAVLWEGAFNQPDIKKSIYLFSTLLIVGGITWIMTFKKHVKHFPTAKEYIILLITGFCIVLYLLTERLHIFLGFFLCIYAGNWLLLFREKSKSIRIVSITVLIICFMFEFTESIFYGKQNAPTLMDSLYDKIMESRKEMLFSMRGDYKSLAEWVRNNTKFDDVFLTPFETGPLILTYTGRPIVLHPKFESKHIRDKYRKFVFSLYDDEQTFYEVCKQYKTNYFLYQIDMLFDLSKKSLQYLAKYPAINKESAVYKFHFAPERLQYFSPVYQLKSCRLYKVLNKDEKKIHYEPLYDATYDESLFTTDNTVYFNTAVVKKIFPAIQQKDRYFYFAFQSFNQLRVKDTKYYLQKAINTNIPDYRVYFLLGEVYFSLNKFDSAIENYRKSISIEPMFIPSYVGLGSVLNHIKRYQEAIDVGRKAISISENIPEPYVILGISYLSLKKYDEALDAFKTALRIDPNLTIARQKYKETQDLLTQKKDNL